MFRKAKQVEKGRWARFMYMQDGKEKDGKLTLSQKQKYDRWRNGC